MLMNDVLQKTLFLNIQGDTKFMIQTLKIGAE